VLFAVWRRSFRPWPFILQMWRARGLIWGSDRNVLKVRTQEPALQLQGLLGRQGLQGRQVALRIQIHLGVRATGTAPQIITILMVIVRRVHMDTHLQSDQSL
jgi:hypothetical protein